MASRRSSEESHDRTQPGSSVSLSRCEHSTSRVLPSVSVLICWKLASRRSACSVRVITSVQADCRTDTWLPSIQQESGKEEMGWFHPLALVTSHESRAPHQWTETRAGHSTRSLSWRQVLSTASPHVPSDSTERIWNKFGIGRFAVRDDSWIWFPCVSVIMKLTERWHMTKIKSWLRSRGFYLKRFSIRRIRGETPPAYALLPVFWLLCRPLASCFTSSYCAGARCSLSAILRGVQTFMPLNSGPVEATRSPNSRLRWVFRRVGLATSILSSW
jgi:hypothetical protein